MRLEAGENTSVTTTENKFRSASIGASFSPQGLSGLGLSASSAKGKSKESRTSYTPTEVKAAGTLKLESGKDTNILGSKAKGEKIEVNVGGNLTIETLQEKETYEEKNTSAGFNLSCSMNQMLDPAGSGKMLRSFSKPAIGASVSKGSLESYYRSAHEQTGIFAGKGGFDIYVEKNTDLKGAVIASDAEARKNCLSTGTFSFSDLENGADYSAKSIGAEYHHYGSYDKMSRQEKNKIYNTIGLSPSLSTPAKGDANSTTTSAVAPGTIDIRKNPTQDISALSRDTNNALNELGRIFDKQKIEEQQELAKTFGEEAFRLAHNLPDDGSGRKVAVHAIIGGIMSQITGAGFASGAIGAGVNEAIIGEIKKIKDPGTAQIVSAIVGAAAAKAVSGNAGSGATSVASGTKWNAEYEELFRSMISPEEVPYFQEAYDRIDSLIDDVSSEAMNEAKYLVDSGQLDIRNMPSDYTTIQMSIGEGIKAATVACIIDKFGNVYGTIAFAPGVAATAVPLNIGAGWLAISGKEETSDAYRTYISGWSGSFTALAGVGGTLGLSAAGTLGEIDAGGSVALNATIGYTFYAGNILRQDYERQISHCRSL